MKALGMIEVRGYLAAVEALDSALKAANVSLVDTVCVRGGLVTVLVDGDVGAVKAAMDASAAAAERVGQIISVHVIPRPATDILRMLRGDIQHPHGEGPDGAPKKGGEPDVSLIEETQTKDVAEEPEPEETESEEPVLDEEEPNRMEPDEVDADEPAPAYSKDQLDGMTVAALRRLAREVGITNMTRQEIRFAKKQELIHAILEYLGQEN